MFRFFFVNKCQQTYIAVKKCIVIIYIKQYKSSANYSPMIPAKCLRVIFKPKCIQYRCVNYTFPLPYISYLKNKNAEGGEQYHEPKINIRYSILAIVSFLFPYI